MMRLTIQNFNAQRLVSFEQGSSMPLLWISERLKPALLFHCVGWNPLRVDLGFEMQLLFLLKTLIGNRSTSTTAMQKLIVDFIEDPQNLSAGYLLRGIRHAPSLLDIIQHYIGLPNLCAELIRSLTALFALWQHAMTTSPLIVEAGVHGFLHGKSREGIHRGEAVLQLKTNGYKYSLTPTRYRRQKRPPSHGWQPLLTICAKLGRLLVLLQGGSNLVGDVHGGRR